MHRNPTSANNLEATASMTLTPTQLWQYFDDLCQIPRGSGNEAGVRDYVRRFAQDHGWAFDEDEAGNCVISVPGRGAGMGAPPIIIQSHMDMVCVKDEEHASHDFMRDPIVTRVASWTENGQTREVLMGTGTTLGADNGIGLVSGLAVATDPELTDCPPLELLFTVDEETGLHGALKLDPKLMRADLLLNLDSEELGDICISCAGGRDLVADWSIVREQPAEDEVPIKLYISGLPGGHSGVQIHTRRGNAILSVIGNLLAVPDFESSVRLASLSGGVARNVIPGAMSATVWARGSAVTAIMLIFSGSDLRADILHNVDEDVAGSLVYGAARVDPRETPRPISHSASSAILKAIASVPHGVQSWSPHFEGMVETSNNVAVLTTSETNIHFHGSTRSSRQGAIEAFQEGVRPALEASGAGVWFGDGYPGWPADPDNPLLNRAERVFERVLGYAPRVSAIHAGLECGVLKGKRPSLQMISFGPDIAGAHTANERIAIDSVPPFYACLTGLLRDLC
jgi:dipeptidase D